MWKLHTFFMWKIVRWDFLWQINHRQMEQLNPSFIFPQHQVWSMIVSTTNGNAKWQNSAQLLPKTVATIHSVILVFFSRNYYSFIAEFQQDFGCHVYYTWNIGILISRQATLSLLTFFHNPIMYMYIVCKYVHTYVLLDLITVWICRKPLNVE